MRSPLILAQLAVLAASAAAQPASDLLQSGIYSQDTLGDLDAAIRIYRQILNSGPGLRVYAAQAQYRLGTCLLRKGDTAGAAAAFQSVIREYSGEPALVAGARELLSRGGLLPAPWADSEVAEYRWTIPGVENGWSISRIGSLAKSPHTLRIQMTFYSPHLNVTQVDVDRETMLPITAAYRGPSPLNATGLEAAGIFRNTNGVETHVPRSDTAYAYGELLYLLRRMPLFPSWTGSIHVVSAEQTSLALNVAVGAVEDIVVPAGKFKCYKVQLTPDPQFPAPRYSTVGLGWPGSTAGETLWYGIEGARPLVKAESGGAHGELASLRAGERNGVVSYRDPQVGYSFTVPADWIFHARSAFNGPGTSVDLLDPEFQTWVVISAKSKTTALDRVDTELQAGAEQRLKDRPRYSVRGAMQRWQLGGHPALTLIMDQGNGANKRVDYVTWVQSESTRASVAVQMDAADFERFRVRFQPVLDSFRIP